MMPILIAPALVGVLVDHGQFSESYAGWVIASGSFGVAALLMFISVRIHKLNLKKLAGLSLGVAVIIDIYSSFSVNPDLYFLVTRFLAGIAMGAANIVVYTSFATMPNYERGYGLFVLMQFVVSGLGLYFLIIYSQNIGVQGMYLSLATLDLIALFLIRYLPDRSATREVDGSSHTEMKVLLSLVTLFAVVGFGLFEASGFAQFTYIERVGMAIPLSELTVGNIMLVSSLIGIPGSLVIILIGTRFGLIPPLLFGMLCSLVGMGILLTTKTYTSYFISACLLGFGWALCLPYIQTLLAKLDKKGSALAAGNSFATIGAALGPGFAAMVVGNSNYDRVFALSITLLLFAGASLLISIIRMQINAK